VSTRDLIDLLVLGAIWGASFLFMRLAAPEFGPIPLIAARVGIGALFLVFVLARRGGLNRLVRHAVPLAVLGATNSAVPFTLFAYAVLSVTAGFAAVLNSTAPLFGALVAFLWLRETPSRARVLGLAVGFAGVLILVWDRLSFSGDRGALAVFAGLTAAVLYGIAANYTRKRLGDVDSLVIATGSLIAATLLMASPTFLYWPAKAPSAASWISTILLGVFCTGVAYVLYFRLLVRVGPARALTVTYLIPVFGLLWGYVFLREAVTRRMALACVVIFVGIALATGTLTRAFAIRSRA
jgi:drug/metabolite transporter (DMT)-like permease